MRNCDNSECKHPVARHPDLDPCDVSNCECSGYDQGGGSEEPGRWLEQPDWKPGWKEANP